MNSSLPVNWIALPVFFLSKLCKLNFPKQEMSAHCAADGNRSTEKFIERSKTPHSNLLFFTAVSSTSVSVYFLDWNNLPIRLSNTCCYGFCLCCHCN